MESKSREYNFSQTDYSTTDTANELVIVNGSKRKKIDDKESNAKKKDATGGKKSRNFALEKDKEKITKKRKRQLAAVQARKVQKLTQEELFASLAEYRLDAETVRQLSSTIHSQDKQTPDKVTNTSEKLNSLSKSEAHTLTIHKKARIQENYYPTDDEISDEDSLVEGKDDSELDRTTYGSVTTYTEDITSDGVVVKKRKTKKLKIKISETVDSDDEDDENIANAPRKKILVKKDQPDNITDIDCTEASTSSGGPETINNGHTGKRKYVSVCRDSKIEENRSLLPIYGEEIPIVEAINDNIVTVLCGETGSGKTTQVPQFLYEAGYATDGQIIGITEPRRVAAISMAQRVGEELGLRDAVSYQIRYEGTRSSSTRILFMTDGVLMKEMENDIMLTKYSAILIDEAHERSMYSDVLIGMLSRISPLRAKTGKPLKLIIMSATLRLQDFLHERLFPTITPKVIKVDARQYPVTVHFEKKTPDNYMAAAFRKTCRIHESLPEGTILIFVSGQQEVHQLIDKLKSRYPIRLEKDKAGESLIRGSKKWKKARSEVSRDFKLENFRENSNNEDTKLDGEDLLESGIGNDIWDDYNEELADETMDDPISILPPPPFDIAPLYCLPLYSLLSTMKQKKVFEMPPDGARMCVVATNVAETSLTIPGVKYVVDTGFEKQRLYDPITGVSKFVVSRVSQASADQRAGRAGRIAAGHAYRLYSSAVFQDLEQFSMPEIMNKPADQLVLHLKSMNIVKVINFPFPSAPDTKSLKLAEERLVRMGALSKTTRNDNTEARITSLGKTLAVFPLAPAYGKVIAMANQNGILPYAISLISALSVREPLIPISSLRGANDEETKALMTEVLKLRRSWCGKGSARRLGDLLVLLKAVAASEGVKMDHNVCSKLGLRHKAMQEIRRLRIQLTNIITSTFKTSIDMELISQLPLISDTQAQMLRQMMVTGLVDCLAKRVDRAVTKEEIPRGAYQTMKLQEYVFIDPCSVIYTEEPEYVVYQEIVHLGNKKCMQTLMSVDPEWLPRLAESYCDFIEIKDEEPRYDESNDEIVRKVSVAFGPLKWKLDPVDKPIGRDIMLYRYFAMFLLQGKIMPKLVEYMPKLLAPPTTMIRSWSRLQQRAERLLNKLIEKEIHTRAALTQQFYNDENFLLEEYLQWQPESLHSAITLMWPPLEEKLAKMGRNKMYK